MSRPTPAMSVVVPTHGRVPFCLETLASLERQSLDDFEVIVTDDSPSTQDREAIAAATAAYVSRTSRPARYVFTTPGLGQPRNTNQGLAAAAGEFVRILHSDDVLAPRALEAEVQLLRDPRLNLQVLYHLVEAFTSAPRFDRQPVLSLVQPSFLFRTTMHSSTPLPSATAFRRDLLPGIGGGMREDFDFLCDWDLLVRLLAGQQQSGRFVARLSEGFVGWRLHANSTTGRLWHRHFLEHERMMTAMRDDAALCASVIGDRRACDTFFAHAVRYRYRRLAGDVSGMPAGRLARSLARVARCAMSPRSLRDRLTPAPWTWPMRRRYPAVALPRRHGRHGDGSGADAASTFVEPRAGWRFAASAHLSKAIVRWGESYVARRGGAGGRVPASSPAASGGPAPVTVSLRVEICARFPVSPGGCAATCVVADFDNSLNLWPLRQLLGEADEVTIHQLNRNRFVEPVLHQIVKFTRPGAALQIPLMDNQHLTSFGLKALIDEQNPGQFAWSTQQRIAPAHHVLRYTRTAAPPAAFTAPHTGWTFGMLTTGTRLEHVQRFVESIEATCAGPYEILVVSPIDLGDLGRRPGVRVLRFTEHDDRGWITRKKNLIAAEARYSDLLICHDRFWLSPGFISSFEAWGYAYGLAAVRVQLPDGRRGLDWGVVSSENRVWSGGGLLDYRAYSRYAYNPGGATLIRKAYWREFPWNDNLFWNEHEDVELCRRIQRAGGVIALAAGTLITAEDRWLDANPVIPYCEENEVLYGRPVGEQRIRFLGAA